MCSKSKVLESLKVFVEIHKRKIVLKSKWTLKIISEFKFVHPVDAVLLKAQMQTWMKNCGLNLKFGLNTSPSGLIEVYVCQKEISPY